MDRHHVKRLPMVDRSGRLVGIVSRGDLLAALVRSDADIRAEIEQDVLGEALCGCAPPSTASSASLTRSRIRPAPRARGRRADADVPTGVWGRRGVGEARRVRRFQVRCRSVSWCNSVA
ncbi:CBS domain-containing protein [Embleya sp. NBC_00896]|uniref:CBS domain-containing protein n=1 Tax=Embleya sp. NBC_00896 TaxID=2975961 RepID=UPI002F915EEB